MTSHEVEAVARRLESEGWFDRCRGGAQPACSYFARQVAYVCNPNGDPSLPGWLRKGGGHEVDGYSEDAIALNGDPNDFHNVMDLVAGAGGDSASVRSANLNPRREHDVWEAPRPLSARELSVLGKGGAPVPNPVPVAGWNSQTHGALLARLAGAGITDTRRIAEQFAFSFPSEGWGQKSADPHRPISDNVIARRDPFVGFQVVPATLAPTSYDLRGQVFHAVTPVNHLGDVSKPEPPPPPPPPPPTTEPLPDLAAVLAELRALRQEVNALVAREFPDYVGHVDAFGNTLPLTLQVKK
jgi:hypothetical protein